MKAIKTQRAITLALSLFFLNFFLCRALAEDIKSKYFNLQIYQGCSLAEFARRIDIGQSLNIATHSKETKDFSSLIAQNLDSLYLEICDVLDIHMYTCQGKINVVPTRGEIAGIVPKETSGRQVPPAIYNPLDNTIYVSFADFTVEILAHEISHAIISNYFITPPPLKVQEILASYVEYAIRKKIGTLNVKK
jgi:hypothetical protein